jgi:3-hydroxyisobutyrate dehydrogenase-like beta-hydroxyacid dehydrogenase
MGLALGLLVEAISGGLLDSAYFRLRSKAVTGRHFGPGLKLRLAARDAALM